MPASEGQGKQCAASPGDAWLTPAHPCRSLAGDEIDFAYPGGQRVLEGAELRLEPGEIVGLLGPNGAGKSTLVQLLAGLLAPRAGTVLLDDRPLAQWSRRQIACRLAVVPQTSVVPFAFTVAEVVGLGRHPHLGGLAWERAEDRAIVQAALRSCGIEPLADRSLDALSAGERQRVLLARALCQQPGLLLLDEPAAFLDVRQQVELYRVLRETAQRGCGILAVLHDLNAAAQLCDRVILLAGKSVAAHGAPATVFTAETLTRVFGTPLSVVRDADGRPAVAPHLDSEDNAS